MNKLNMHALMFTLLAFQVFLTFTFSTINLASITLGFSEQLFAIYEAAIFGMTYQIIALGVPILFMYKLSKISLIDTLKFKKIDMKNILLIVCMTLLLIPISNVIGLISMMIFDTGFQASTQNIIENKLIAIISLTIIPPIFEELLFRNYLFYNLKDRLLKVCFYSALYFGLFHMNSDQMFYAIFLGFTFCLFVHYTGSILASMLSHLLINGTSLLSIFISSSAEMTTVSEPTTSMILSYFLLAGACFLIFLPVFNIFKKYNIKKQNHMEILNLNFVEYVQPLNELVQNKKFLFNNVQDVIIFGRSIDLIFVFNITFCLYMTFAY